MRQVRDTFIHFLYDNLQPLGIPVHYVRRDPSDPSADLLALNSVNLQFLNVQLRVDISIQNVSIDVVNDDENTGVDWLGSVNDLLSASYTTPLFDYSGSSPVALSGHIYWDKTKMNFKRVSNDQYVHYSCLLPLAYHL